MDTIYWKRNCVHMNGSSNPCFICIYIYIHPSPETLRSIVCIIRISMAERRCSKDDIISNHCCNGSHDILVTTYRKIHIQKDYAGQFGMNKPIIRLSLYVLLSSWFYGGNWGDCVYFKAPKQWPKPGDGLPKKISRGTWVCLEMGYTVRRRNGNV